MGNLSKGLDWTLLPQTYGSKNQRWMATVHAVVVARSEAATVLETGWTDDCGQVLRRVLEQLLGVVLRGPGNPHEADSVVAALAKTIEALVRQYC